MKQRSPIQLLDLVAVLAQRFDNGLHHALIKNRSASKVTSTLGTHSNVAVRFSRSTVLNFTRGRQAKTLFGPFVGFHFVVCHDTIVFKLIWNRGLYGKSPTYQRAFGDFQPENPALIQESASNPRNVAWPQE